ncbi:predicted protein [Histoplasma mississippiense (nom. inval.)]|nr:predicted protein [Histoplasma mississippiense (nom. inval.)]EDN04446.1 predicted protein [Histoplasma mississippiense (nom. inval.)]
MAVRETRKENDIYPNLVTAISAYPCRQFLAMCGYDG